MNGKVLFVALFFLVSNSCSGTGIDGVKKVNTQVAAIDDSLKLGHYQEIRIAEQGLSEGVPPMISFYTNRGNGELVVAEASVGHETWSNVFRYYFYRDGKLMKYVKTTIGRPDNPVKQAMIFDASGKMLWKNTDEPIVAADDILHLFEKMQGIRTQIAEY